MYNAKVLADSIVSSGARLTTFEVTFPRFILAEANTHRKLSRNSASSRAIPVEKRIAQLLENPFVPESFAANKSGMQAGAELGDAEQDQARAAWLSSRDEAVDHAGVLVDLAVHKQHANRVLEPYAWHTAIFTATDWDNFFALRDHKAAQPEMQITARHMRTALYKSEPRVLSRGDWHLPHVTYEERKELGIEYSVKASVVRCAAVSFERQYEHREMAAIIKRHDQMAQMGHWSTFEHQAMVFEDEKLPPFGPHYRFEEHSSGHFYVFGRRGRWVEAGWYCGNFKAPFVQYRKLFADEAVFRG